MERLDTGAPSRAERLQLVSDLDVVCHRVRHQGMRKKVKRKRRGRPLVTVRLSRETIERLDAVAGAFGWNRSDFVRGFIEAVVSGKQGEFLDECHRRSSQQMLPGLDEAASARKGVRS